MTRTLMRFSKSVLIWVVSVSAVGLAFAANTPPVTADAKSTPILPQSFAGWQVQGAVQSERSHSQGVRLQRFRVSYIPPR